jgi:hypothetical protein
LIAPELAEAASVYPHPPLSNSSVENAAVPKLSVMALVPPESEAPRHALVPMDMATAAPARGLPLLSFARTFTGGRLRPAVAGIERPETVCAELGGVEKDREATVLNVATTDRGLVIVSTQEPAPVQVSPLQPAKPEPAEGKAERVTVVPELKFAEHAMAEQSIPAGLLSILPLPLPAALTSKVFVVLAGGPKEAVMDRAAVIETAQDPVPVQAPLQPRKADPAVGAAVRMTEVP